ncbi:MAG: S-adenosylmethionine decarboxylase related protein [Parcubacteria group bacterium GW2011_GWC1_43_11b]|nr:MAG: S-adenosylmethionine decarboxylase related protein [Parcubacteria group bacterium GW2011_GWB1_42_9]KKS89267.1 MAG: S-adenosylmethionine decarboxylase related protein [Parcubacteria group bacterium GW2011_GWC1_43_11b]KKT10115.1 MAG: S-adenosylmethionine decarboxylase related protein [Parcubacteria group bacterium GW2011_GWA1_43_21]
MDIKTLRQEYKKARAWGLLASIDLAGCDHQLIQSPQAIKQFVKELVDLLKMKAHGPTRVEKFAEGSLEGYSAFQFIETSSITLHFDDKQGDRAFIDVFSCCFFNPESAEKFAKKYFKAKTSRSKILLRK